MMQFDSFEQFQSGFQPHHSAEAALLKENNDLLITKGMLSFMILLDLLAEFDVVNCDILLAGL
jgi:hypothetical protein